MRSFDGRRPLPLRVRRAVSRSRKVKFESVAREDNDNQTVLESCFESSG